MTSTQNFTQASKEHLGLALMHLDKAQLLQGDSAEDVIAIGKQMFVALGHIECAAKYIGHTADQYAATITAASQASQA